MKEMLSVTERAVQLRAVRESWQSIPRKGRGGGNLWLVSSMPKSMRTAIASALLRQPLPQSGMEMRQQPALPQAATNMSVPCADIDTTSRQFSEKISLELARASDRERRIALARLAFVFEVNRLSAIIGKESAVRHLVIKSQLGELAPILADQVAEACAIKRGGALTRRTLYRWAADYAEGGAAALLPSQRKVPLPDWGAAFLSYWQKPQHPPVTLAYGEFCDAMRKAGKTPPSIHAVYRLLARMSAAEREAGRDTGNALLKLRPYRRRDTSELWPTDAYTADGTTFDAEVLHPQHGQPFKPELTAVLDIATRRCVGLSIALAESALTVLDALRMACVFGGIPALFYTDGGAGYINKLMRDDRTGLFQRLGISPCNAIPGRPQGKGLMERAVKTLWVSAAQGLESYTGANMDQDAAHKNFKLSRKAIKDAAAGKKPKRAVLPTWDEFKAHLLRRVESYNATPHRELPVYRDAQGRRQHYSPDEYWKTFVARGFEPMEVASDIATELFMPGEKRQTRNGWINFYGGRYFAAELAEWHGDAVEVRYDIWNSERVWAWTLAGQKICEAVLEGNTQPYFAASRVDAAREKRATAQVKRLDAKLQRVAPGAEIVLPERETPEAITEGSAEYIYDDAPHSEAAILVESASVLSVPIKAQKTEINQENHRPTIFQNTYERYQWLMAHTDAHTAADTLWLIQYRQSEEYIDLADLYAAQGIAG